MRARTEGDLWQAGVANLGHRPMVGGEDLLLEVHLFDFDVDVYGQEREVQFVAKLRDEERFATMDDMVSQMKEDATRARSLLKAQN